MGTYNTFPTKSAFLFISTHLWFSYHSVKSWKKKLESRKKLYHLIGPLTVKSRSEKLGMEIEILNMQINLSKINNPVINNKILFILALWYYTFIKVSKPNGH